MRGAWIMTHEELPMGYTHDFLSDGHTICRIYSDDSVFYSSEIKSMKSDNIYESFCKASDVIITPGGETYYTLIDVGGGTYKYFEGQNPKPFSVINDTTVVIQSVGTKYTWQKAHLMPQERINEITNIIKKEIGKERTHNFVLSSTERHLKKSVHALVLLVVVLVLTVVIIVNVILNIYRKKQHLESQLRLIKEEREKRPQAVQQAIMEVEEDFFCSDFYRMLCRKINSGAILRNEDWNEIEEHLRPVYPGFSNRLYGLCRMSELEYHVCLLIKLRIAPSEMASVLSKDTSTISTVRSRLYRKVFGKKGSSKDWDNFVNTL
jgi:hypothetical protein